MGLSPSSGLPPFGFVTGVTLRGFVTGFVTGTEAGGGFVTLSRVLRASCFRSSAMTSAMAGQGWVDQWRVLQTMQRGASMRPIIAQSAAAVVCARLCKSVLPSLR